MVLFDAKSSLSVVLAWSGVGPLWFGAILLGCGEEEHGCLEFFSILL